MSKLDMVDLRALRTAVRGDVVASEDWLAAVKLSDADRQINQLLAIAEDEAERIRGDAFAEGFASGKEQALQAMSEELLRLRHQGQSAVEQTKRQVTELALLVVERLMPQLGAEKLVPNLVQQALAEVEANRFVQIVVNPAVEKEILSQLDQLRRVQPAVETIEVVTDREVDEFACVLRSETGEVRAGMATQLAALRSALQASESAGQA